ncbi:hypothetical protein SAMN02787142_2852 [Burkholderia sp. WP9]|nr:hypothetical protein SAMN02787142_2852 [Burkholderia sp. WP9]
MWLFFPGRKSDKIRVSYCISYIQIKTEYKKIHDSVMGAPDMQTADYK